MAYYVATVSTDGSGDGDNLDANNNPVWNGHFHGLLMAVKFDFDGSTAAGADTTLSEPNGLARTIRTLTDTNTDTTIYPQEATTDSSGTTQGSAHLWVDSTNLKVVIAQGGADVTDAVKVIVQVIEG